jgi:hypothetical protein
MMRQIVRITLGLVVAVTPASTAQTTSTPTADHMRAAYEAHQGDFDYLLGDWEFTGTSPAYGQYRGFWSAVRLPTGQILDEYRVVDDAGHTVRLTMTIRSYNAARDRWELVGTDPGGGLQNTGTGTRVGGDIQIEQTFGVAVGNPFILRIRYYNIGSDHFSWTADRSTNQGKTWTKDFQHIEAHRLGPARSIDPLTAAKLPR